MGFPRTLIATRSTRVILRQWNRAASSPSKSISMDLQTELNHSAGQGDLTQVRAQLQDLKNRNMIPNKIIYSSLIHSSVQGGHTTSAIHLLGDFQKELYYEADAALFDPILAQLIRKSEIRAAEDLW